MPSSRYLIESQVLSTSAASVTFNNIPATYTDLVIKAAVRDNVNSNGSAIAMTFNGSTTNYSGKVIYGDGTTAASTNLSGLAYGWAGTANPANSTANTFASHEIYIPSYTSSNFKPYSVFSVVETNATTAEYLVRTAGLWSGSQTISSINLALSSANSIFAAGSTFYLYGIKSSAQEITPKATGGDITYDSTYIYHTFRQSGTFTPTQSLTADYLVVAGGGAGGSQRGGGGGAGGLRSTVTATGGGGSLESAISLTAQNYTITVGAGGALSTSGSNSSIAGSGLSTITSVGGGRGGYDDNFVGATGGSGGGGNGDSAPNTAGSGTANQGYEGGSGTVSYAYGGGGGGGAGAAGGNSSAISENKGGTGGNGVQITALANSTLTGSDNGYYAGGGGGGSTRGDSTYSTPGLGGGGRGFNDGTGNPSNGLANTGGGGGGNSSSPATAGLGGSGVVIVRYAR